MTIICLSIISLITILFSNTGNGFVNKRWYIKYRCPIYAIIIFGFWVGLRYNPDIDPDFMNYWDVAQYGESFHEYDRFEFFPQKIAYCVYHLGLSPSWFFITMGCILISFTVWAAVRLKDSYIPFIFYGLILFYLKFDMNGMRQGVAMSIFLCSLTFIQEKKWKMYFLLIILAFGFHRSVVVWAPVYFLTFINWNRNSKKMLLLIILLMTMSVFSLLWLIQEFSFIFVLMNMSNKVSGGDIDFIENETVSSGIGVILNYIRWAILLYYIPRIASKTHNNNLYIFLGIFLMGAVLYTFGKETIYLSRVALYPQIAELLMYPYLFEYFFKVKKNILMQSLLVFQVIAFTYANCDYFAGWNFVI